MEYEEISENESFLYPHSQKLSWESYKDVHIVTEMCNYHHQHWYCVESCMWQNGVGRGMDLLRSETTAVVSG